MAGFKKGSVDGWDQDSDDATVETGTDETDDEATSNAVREQRSSGQSAMTVAQEASPRLPWIHRRSSITDGRENTKQLHLQDATVDLEREQRSEIESLLGESVKKADLREAALIIGLAHVDEVAEQLQEWGYAVE